MVLFSIGVFFGSVLVILINDIYTQYRIKEYLIDIINQMKEEQNK